ncbi:silicon transporter [Nitzschia inconspicua]|uniref:Silicon transporter n=1 Tax=Nitzschia inconspicua TaxID=303405 RepID=A0A9K3KJW6_9STRA|nr:silicon transporter [Nitzschia inconspicua]
MAPLSTSTPSSSADSSKPIFYRIVSFIKTAFSMTLVLFSVVVVSAAIFTKQTDATYKYGIHPIVALCVFWFSLAWLAIMEGGLNCMVGLQPIPKSLYKKTHPKAYLCTKAAHGGDRIERFIVGRQYIDLTIVFSTSFMVNAIAGAQVLGLPPVVNDIFLGSDLGVILCFIVFGQLISVINCSHNMLDYINNWCMVFTTYLAFLIEATGILHAVYFVQIIFTKLAGHKNLITGNVQSSKKQLLEKKKQKNNKVELGADAGSTDDSGTEEEAEDEEDIALELAETPSTAKPIWKRVLFWARIVFSLAMSAFAITVFMKAMVQGNTTLRAEIPLPVAVISLIILLLLGGIMEALQIALFAVKHLDKATIEGNPRARRNCQLIFGSGGDKGYHDSKLNSFLVGRQIAQTVVMFMIARIVSVNMKVPGETMFGVSATVQKILFDSGLLNSLVFTIFASLSWRVTANFFPMLYLGSPLSIWIIRLCLLVDASGICDAAWVFAKIVSYLVGYKSDDYYIAAATAAAATDDKPEDVEVAADGQGEEILKKKSGYKKQSSVTTESLDSSSSCEGSCHAANSKKERN